jgi:hypothetical protein
MKVGCSIIKYITKFSKYHVLQSIFRESWEKMPGEFNQYASKNCLFTTEDGESSLLLDENWLKSKLNPPEVMLKKMSQYLTKTQDFSGMDVYTV